MKQRWRFAALAATSATVAACGAGEEEGDAVARVGDHVLTVDQAVELLVDEEGLAADVNNVRSLANFWIDYTLLAEAVDRDSTFRDLTLEPLVDQQLWRTMLFALRDSVIQVDTFITPTELQSLYEAEDQDVEIRARHIMLTVPPQATPAQRDSVLGALEQVRERILGGASFEAVAQQVSHDRVSAASGGDLGYFGRGDMVAPFEEAALALQPGELSPVVQTPMGLHLIRVDDRRARGFEEAAADFRRRVQERRVQVAESTFVAAIEARVEPELVADAADVVREMARNPGTSLSRRAARRPLVEWRGGAVSVGELQTLLRLESQALRARIAEAEDDVVATFLNDLARRELLVEEARSAGLHPGAEEVDSMVVEAAVQLRTAARTLGLRDIEPAPGEPRRQAVARAVESALADNLAGATRFVPLGLVGFQLREGASFAIDDAGVGQAILRIGQVRAGRMLSPTESGAGDPAADTISP